MFVASFLVNLLLFYVHYPYSVVQLVLRFENWGKMRTIVHHLSASLFFCSSSIVICQSNLEAYVSWVILLQALSFRCTSSDVAQFKGLSVGLTTIPLWFTCTKLLQWYIGLCWITGVLFVHNSYKEGNQVVNLFKYAASQIKVHRFCYVCPIR